MTGDHEHHLRDAIAAPEIALLAMGGTISAVADAPRNDRGLGATALAQLAGGAKIHPLDVARVPSRAITPELMRRLATAVRSAIAEGCEGVVVTHGTDTIEETAYALSLMLPREVPVALTGAMRSLGAPGYDGEANLRAAVAAAADRRCTALGPVVVLGDELHLARWVAKVHTTRPAAFASPGLGPVGSVVEGRVQLSIEQAPSDLLGMPETLEAHLVELVWIAAGADGHLIDAAASYADGIVVAGTGGGHVPPPAARAIGRAIGAGVPVVLSSRGGAGPLLQETYAGEGGERHLRSLGVVSAGPLPPLKARLRLHVALALGRAVHEAFS
jgi:L-asparaginase